MVAAREIARGISAEGRSKTYKRRGVWAVKKKNGGKFPTFPKKVKEVAATTKAPRYYPAEDVPKPLTRRFTRKAPTLRASVQPGHVVIILAGRFKGKRAVSLKQLPSGMLLITGPFNLNGVPLRRVNPAYLIGTSVTVNISKVNLSKVDDSLFKAPKKLKEKKSEAGFFNEEEKKEGLSPERIALQKSVDEGLTAALDKEVTGYLKSLFTLKGGDRPHLLKF
eukprot:jgi/Botrbrau1/15608/Bobra.0264s0008.1